MDVIRGGVQLSSLDLSQSSFYTFGRLSSNDVVLEHPSISRCAGVPCCKREWGKVGVSGCPPDLIPAPLASHPCHPYHPYSRLHAVVQYREEDGAAFMFDPGSTHGVYVNKARIAPRTYAQLR